MNIKGYSEDCNEIYNISTPPAEFESLQAKRVEIFPLDVSEF
jgi:hypothetical protein